MKGLRFGLTVTPSEPYPVLAQKWRYFEELGFDSIWHCDHLLRPNDSTGPLFEAWTLLAAMAAETSRIRVGVLVTSNVLRHPALLAQEAITVDHVSEGRLELGIGCGWFEEEHRRFRIPLYEPAARVDRFSEALEIIDPLLRGEAVSYEGRHYQLSEARLQPRPVQSPRPPSPWPPTVPGCFGSVLAMRTGGIPRGRWRRWRGGTGSWTRRVRGSGGIPPRSSVPSARESPTQAVRACPIFGRAPTPSRR